MSQEVSEAEYQYYRTERLTNGDLELGKIVMLYARLQGGNPNAVVSENIPTVHSDSYVYGRELCRISNILVNSNLPTEVDISFDSINPGDNEARLSTLDNSIFSVRTPRSLLVFHRVFFDLISDNITPKSNSTNEGTRYIWNEFFVPDSFFVDTSAHGSDLLQSMMVAGKEEGDGSAGAMVPARPKDPSPLRAAEIENPTLFCPLQ